MFSSVNLALFGSSSLSCFEAGLFFKDTSLSAVFFPFVCHCQKMWLRVCVLENAALAQKCKIHEYSCVFMCIHVSSWVFMGLHGSSWVFMGLHGSSSSWVFMCVHAPATSSHQPTWEALLSTTEPIPQQNYPHVAIQPANLCNSNSLAFSNTYQ